MTLTSTTDEQQPVFIPKRLIQEARNGSSLDIDEIHAFLEGNKEKSRAIRDMMRELAGDPFISSGTEYYEQSKETTRLETVKKIGRLALYLENDVKRARREYKRDVVKELQEGNAALSISKDFEIFDRRMSLLAVVDPQLCTRVAVNLTLFGNCIKGNGTDEQIKYWLQESGLLFLRGIYGCFAMTELGHGSNVTNIQTLSTYNPSSDTFTITTPDLVATKWWIGGAAHSATHAVVYARLIVEGRDYGVKTFVVPLRDPRTMELKAGITIGDIGAKMGRDGIDNGWIQFHDVVIPREYMLSRFTKVIPGSTPHVEVNEMLDSVSGYAALLSGRVSMTLESYRVGSRFATIATRYAFGRQQFGERGNENQLIDYPLHQYRIIPHIALPYLVAPMAQKLYENYNETLNALYSAKNDKKKLMDVSARLKNLFVDSAALKATGTWLVATQIDELRQSCGGHGYSSYNGFAKGYTDWVVQCTWEGDNNVLCLTSGNSLLKRFVDVVKGKKIGDLQPTSSYLELGFIQKALTTNAGEIIKFSNNSNYYEIWKVILVRYLKHCAEIVRATNNTDAASKPLVSVAKFHALHAMLQEFHRKLSSDESEVSDGATREVLWKVYQLASLYYIDKFSGEVLQLSVLTPDEISEIIQPRMMSLLKEIKPHCIKLTDAFHFPDALINSPIGYYDGDIYHNYFSEVTKNAPKNSAPGAADYAPLLAGILGRGFESSRYGGISEEVFQKLGK